MSEKPDFNLYHPDSRFSAQSVRREWLHLAGSAGAGAALFLLTGDSKRLFAQSSQGDLAILSAALYLEQEAIAAYQAGAESKLLSPPVLAAAVAFQSDHKYHRDGIAGVLKSLGVEPAGPEKRYEFGHLKTEKDILRLARDRENGAATAYATLAANVFSKAVLNFAANVLVDEVRHRTILDTVLGNPTY